MTDWFRRHRVAWIIEIAAIYGFVNRAHIERKFGVSTPQASSDLGHAAREEPRLRYDASRKTYVWRGDE